MSNKSFGQSAETALRDVLKANGYLCIRSAASKLIDIVCIDPRGLTWLFEVKATHNTAVYMSRSAYQREQFEAFKEYMYRFATLETRFRYVVRFRDGHFEVFTPLDEIMREGKGKPLADVLPVRIPPNKPPIVPQDTVAPDGVPRDPSC